MTFSEKTAANQWADQGYAFVMNTYDRGSPEKCTETPQKEEIIYVHGDQIGLLSSFTVLVLDSNRSVPSTPSRFTFFHFILVLNTNLRTQPPLKRQSHDSARLRVGALTGANVCTGKTLSQNTNNPLWARSASTLLQPNCSINNQQPACRR